VDDMTAETPNPAGSTVLDHINGITVPGRPFDEPANEYWALLSLWEGMCFLHAQVERCEEAARAGFNPDGNLKVFAGGNLPQLQRLPMRLLTCSFQWYAISACQYVRTVGSIACKEDQSRPKPLKYAMAVIPEVVVYRDKVAAHYAWTTKNKNDNDAERIASIVPQISFVNDRLVAGASTVTLKKAGKRSRSDAIVPWSLTVVHARLCERYWPGAGDTSSSGGGEEG